MSDIDPNKPNEGAVTGDIDMTKFVPKEDYDKAVSGKDTEVSALQRSLEEAQGQLTDPQYLKFLAEKAATSNDSSGASTDKQTMDKATADRIAKLEATASQLSAVLELQQIESKYKDFNDYRDDVHTLITHGGSNLNFEQAYLIAKSQRSGAAPDVGDAKGKDKPASGTEKPGKFVPEAGSTDKTFKSATDASNAALEEVKEKYGITGDII